MTDHAKALADALRKMRNQYFSQMKFADVEPAAYFREFVRKLDQILAAYDAHLAEAATRENTNAPNLHKD